jgi:hypothetical protein
MTNLTDIYEKLGIFYLGRELDKKTQEKTDNLLLVKNKNLTTHSAIIGMTGSGKTGLGISMIEEAVLDKIPSIIIDPKGDMGNLLLAFDDFDPKKFEPWIDPHEAQKKEIDIPTLATQTAQMWEKGIESWGQSRERVKKYKNGADFTIYTPGSSSGISISILSSFDAPSAESIADSDTFSYMLNSTVTSLLALVNIKADPLTSKEFLLLSSIFSYFWKKDINLSLESLIGHVASPPFEKIGVLPLQSFYPQNERLKLAMLLNNVLASPSFESWIKGESLDIQSLLYTDDLKPRVSILSIAHLNDNERMFFVTLFLNKFISWMRKQSGTSSLRAMLYMDEIYGFFPSTSNPPSKSPMLLLLKQARAFGINITLSTQNPVDLDYKGLSNIGSWFIGRLQTKQDIDRVIDGLLKSGDNAMDKKEISQLLSNLKKRVFLFKSAHRDEIELFSTRWVMSYLKGPISKPEIARLMKDKKEALKNREISVQTFMSHPTKKETTTTNLPRPTLSEKIDQFFYIDTNTQDTQYFIPYLLANSSVKFYDTRREIDYEESYYFKYYLSEDAKKIEWRDEEINDDDFELYFMNAPDSGNYEPLPSFILEAKDFRSLSKEFSNYLYHNKRLKLYRYKSLKLESKLHESKQDFQLRALDLLKDKKEQKIEKLETKFAKQQNILEKKLTRAEAKLAKEEADVSSKTTDTILSFGMTILSAFTGRKSFSRSTTSRAGTAMRSAGALYREKDDVQRAKDLIEEIENDIYEVQEELKTEIDKIELNFDLENYEIEEFFIKPRRADIYNLELAILWESRR